MLDTAPSDLNAATPDVLEHVVGQRSVVQQIKVALEAAWADGKKFDDALLCGPPGLGKTAVSSVVAREMGVDLHESRSRRLRLDVPALQHPVETPPRMRVLPVLCEQSSLRPRESSRSGSTGRGSVAQERREIDAKGARRRDRDRRNIPRPCRPRRGHDRRPAAVATAVPAATPAIHGSASRLRVETESVQPMPPLPRSDDCRRPLGPRVRHGPPRRDPRAPAC